MTQIFKIHTSRGNAIKLLNMHSHAQLLIFNLAVATFIKSVFTSCYTAIRPLNMHSHAQLLIFNLAVATFIKNVFANCCTPIKLLNMHSHAQLLIFNLAYPYFVLQKHDNLITAGQTAHNIRLGKMRAVGTFSSTAVFQCSFYTSLLKAIKQKSIT